MSKHENGRNVSDMPSIIVKNEVIKNDPTEQNVFSCQQIRLRLQRSLSNAATQGEKAGRFLIDVVGYGPPLETE
jgi:hypothetical protein